MAKKKIKKVKVARGKTVKVTRDTFKKTISEPFGLGGGLGNRGKFASASGSGTGADAGKIIASYGGLIFLVNPKKIFPLQNMKQEVSGEWGSHDVIGKKAKAEFLGPGIRQMTFDVTIDATLGIKPHSVIKKMNKMAEEGKVSNFMLGTHKIGKGKWKMEKVSQDFSLIYSGGELVRAKGSVTLSEYF